MSAPDDESGGRLQRLIFGALKALSGPLEAVGPIRVALATGRHFHRQHCSARSAEIAYWAILSSIPFGALLLTALGIGATKVLEAGWSRAMLHDYVAKVATTYLPQAIPDVDATIGWLLGGQQAWGLIGAIALLVTASLVFGAVSRALTSIFGVRARDRYTTTVLFTVTLCALVLIVILGLPALAAIAPFIEAQDGTTIKPLWLHAIADGVLALAFVFLLKAVVARAALPWRLVSLGAALYVLLFEVARWGFSVYLASLSKMDFVYGSFVGVMALIVWAYVVAFLLLATMCLLHVLQERLHATSMGTLLG